jgi:chromosome segregation ATPase
MAAEEYERIIESAFEDATHEDDIIEKLSISIRQLGVQIDHNNEVIAHLSKHTDDLRSRVEQLASDNKKLIKMLDDERAIWTRTNASLVDKNEELEQYVANLRQSVVGV